MPRGRSSHMPCQPLLSTANSAPPAAISSTTTSSSTTAARWPRRSDFEVAHLELHPLPSTPIKGGDGCSVA